MQKTVNEITARKRKIILLTVTSGLIAGGGACYSSGFQILGIGLMLLPSMAAMLLLGSLLLRKNNK